MSYTTRYVSFETAKRLKNSGYPQEWHKGDMSYFIADPPFHFYDSKDSVVGTMTEAYRYIEPNSDGNVLMIAAPTTLEAIDWLETQSIYINAGIDVIGFRDYGDIFFEANILDLNAKPFLINGIRNSESKAALLERALDIATAYLEKKTVINR